MRWTLRYVLKDTDNNSDILLRNKNETLYGNGYFGDVMVGYRER